MTKEPQVLEAYFKATLQDDAREAIQVATKAGSYYNVLLSMDVCKENAVMMALNYQMMILGWTTGGKR